MTQAERVRTLRKELSLTQSDFGKRVGVGKTAISKIEKNENSLTDRMFNSICREFNVNEDWLRSGEGDMFLPFKNEVSETLAQLLEVSNPFYDLILDMMVSFNELDDKGKQAICDYTALLAERMAKRKKED
jgi:transcriptional regulator with XRE-family HTH domain